MRQEWPVARGWGSITPSDPRRRNDRLSGAFRANDRLTSLLLTAAEPAWPYSAMDLIARWDSTHAQGYEDRLRLHAEHRGHVPHEVAVQTALIEAERLARRLAARFDAETAGQHPATWCGVGVRG